MTKRISFGKLKEVYDLPNLLDVQLEAYYEFLQMDVPVAERKRISNTGSGVVRDPHNCSFDAQLYTAMQ